MGIKGDGGTSDDLIGRVAEYDRLRTAIDEVGTGRGRVCTVTGPAGIGKTRLVTEALHAARERGFQVLDGGGAELEQRRPFGAVADCLGIRLGSADERRSLIARLLASGSPGQAGIPAEAATTEFLVVEAVLALVEELCARGPLAMAVDDLQWADASTLLLLHRLARLAPELPVLVVCCWRPLPRRPELDRLTEGLPTGAGPGIVLGPLADGEVIDLLRSSTGAEPGANLRRLASGAGGNPLFVTELVGALELEGALDYRSPGRVESPSASLPPSLPLAILHRLSYLSEDALELLRVAAVLGSRVEASDVCLLLGCSATTLVGTFREVVGAGILEDDGRRLAFRHDLIREALYHDLPAGVRAALHREAARALAGAGAPAGRVAEHAARGASSGDPFAVEWLLRAAADAASRAPAVAVDWLDQAMELAAPADPRRREIMADRAVSLLWSGRVPEAEESCRDLLAGDPGPWLRPRVQLCLAQSLFAGGRGDEAVEVADFAARSPDLSDTERAQVRAWISLGHMATGSMGSATEAADAVLADPSADELATSVALTTMATAINFGGRFGDAVQVQDRAIAVADVSAGQSAHRFPLNFFQAMFLVEVDDLDSARRALARGRQVSEEIGARWNLPLYAWASAWTRFVSGAWDDALAECEASLALADELGTRHGMILTYSLQSMIALHRGDLERAERAVGAAEAEFLATGPQHGLEHVMVWARALVTEAAGDLIGAKTALARTWNELIDAGVAGYVVDLGPDLVRLSVDTGDLAQAEAATVAVEQLAAINGQLARTAGAALHCRGMETADHRLLSEAASSLERSCRPFEAARAGEDAAAALAQAEEPAQARRHYDQALRRYEELEARRAIGRTESRMRELGLRRGPRAKQARPAVGWASLTTTERAVADLAARGLTNPQIAQRLFVSRHTVHTHVSHVLAKLQLTSRVELAAQAALRRTEELRQDPEQVQPADKGHRRSTLDAHPP